MPERQGFSPGKTALIDSMDAFAKTRPARPACSIWAHSARSRTPHNAVLMQARGLCSAATPPSTARRHRLPLVDVTLTSRRDTSWRRDHTLRLVWTPTSRRQGKDAKRSCGRHIPASFLQTAYPKPLDTWGVQSDLCPLRVARSCQRRAITTPGHHQSQGEH